MPKTDTRPEVEETEVAESDVQEPEVAEATEGPPINEELLREVMEGDGIPHRNVAINAALEEYATRIRERRREALEKLRRMSDEGVFDYQALDELDQ